MLIKIEAVETPVGHEDASLWLDANSIRVVDCNARGEAVLIGYDGEETVSAEPMDLLAERVNRARRDQGQRHPLGAEPAAPLPVATEILNRAAAIFKRESAAEADRERRELRTIQAAAVTAGWDGSGCGPDLPAWIMSLAEAREKDRAALADFGSYRRRVEAAARERDRKLVTLFQVYAAERARGAASRAVLPWIATADRLPTAEETKVPHAVISSVDAGEVLQLRFDPHSRVWRGPRVTRSIGSITHFLPLAIPGAAIGAKAPDDLSPATIEDFHHAALCRPLTPGELCRYEEMVKERTYKEWDLLDDLAKAYGWTTSRGQTIPEFLAAAMAGGAGRSLPWISTAQRGPTAEEAKGFFLIPVPSTIPGSWGAMPFPWEVAQYQPEPDHPRFGRWILGNSLLFLEYSQVDRFLPLPPA